MSFLSFLIANVWNFEFNRIWTFKHSGVVERTRFGHFFTVGLAAQFVGFFILTALTHPGSPLRLPAETVDRLFTTVEATPGYRLAVDLPAQTVTTPDGTRFGFEVDSFRKECLLNGWDDIGLTLRYADAIRSYEIQRRQEAPWLFA